MIDFRDLSKASVNYAFEDHQGHTRGVPVNSGLEFHRISSIFLDVFDCEHNHGFRDCWGAPIVIQLSGEKIVKMLQLQKVCTRKATI